MVGGTEQASCKHQTQQHPEATDATERLNRASGYRTDGPVQAGGRRIGRVSQRFTLPLKRSPRRQGRSCQRTLVIGSTDSQMLRDSTSPPIVSFPK